MLVPGTCVHVQYVYAYCTVHTNKIELIAKIDICSFSATTPTHQILYDTGTKHIDSRHVLYYIIYVTHIYIIYIYIYNIYHTNINHYSLEINLSSMALFNTSSSGFSSSFTKIPSSNCTNALNASESAFLACASNCVNLSL